MTYFEVFDKHFPEELARQAKEAMGQDRNCRSGFVGDITFADSAISEAFEWDATEQGFELWDKLNQDYDRVPV